MIIKNYKQWMGVKTYVNNRNMVRKVNEGDVVWLAVGKNVGVEIDGKSKRYSRPVVVLRKHTGRSFTGVPLTSKLHKGTWYVSFEFQGKQETAALVQTRLYDAARVYAKIGELTRGDYTKILNGYIKLISQKNVP